MKSVKYIAAGAGKTGGLVLAGVLGVLLVIKVAWWVLEPLHTVVLVWIVAHAAVKLYAAAANARRLAERPERGRRG